MTKEVMQDQNMEKQIEKHVGCMAGFLQLFDRHHILTGKTTKRLPSTTVFHAPPESENSVGSPLISRELEKPQQTRPLTSPSPDRSRPSPTPELRSPIPSETPPKSPLILPIFELKEGTRSSWKLFKEAPRLSLDSRATFDTKGSPSLHPKENFTDMVDTQRRSTSVVARLMGLEPLPNSSPEQVKTPELRRSASESRISRDPSQTSQYGSIDNHNFMTKQPKRSHSFGTKSTTTSVRDNVTTDKHHVLSICKSLEPLDYSSRNIKPHPPKPSSNRVLHLKSFFDSADFFPEPKQTVSIYGEIEKRVKSRRIHERTKDLETLNQILEAMQLKGLLRHSHKSSESEQISHRNFVYDESPMKPSSFRPAVHRNLNFAGVNVRSPRREVPVNERNVRSPVRSRSPSSPTRSESNAKRSNSMVKHKPMTVETRRKVNESMEQQRVSPVRSPKLINSKGIGPDHSISNRSPRSNKRSTAEICRKEKINTFVIEDESSSISETTVSSSSQTDTERSKMEDYKNGRSLLERCDKLLHSIAEITVADSQPSPVSVLDSSSFYKDDSFSPSPVIKGGRSIDFKEQSVELEEEIWSPAFSPIQSKSENKSEDSDFLYISDILQASNYMPEDSDVFLLLEKQQYLQGKDTSKFSRLQRKLTFDTITEILDRNKQLPPWEVFSCSESSIAKPLLHKIWFELNRIRKRDLTEDLLEFICGILKRDFAGDAINGWEDCHMEISDAVLDIERLIFKDLVGETIRDLATFAEKNAILAPRRKLVF